MPAIASHFKALPLLALPLLPGLGTLTAPSPAVGAGEAGARLWLEKGDNVRHAETPWLRWCPGFPLPAGSAHRQGFFATHLWLPLVTSRGAGGFFLPLLGSADSRASRSPVPAIWASRRNVVGIKAPRHWRCPLALATAPVAIGSNQVSHLR